MVMRSVDLVISWFVCLMNWLSPPVVGSDYDQISSDKCPVKLEPMTDNTAPYWGNTDCTSQWNGSTGYVVGCSGPSMWERDRIYRPDPPRKPEPERRELNLSGERAINLD